MRLKLRLLTVVLSLPQIRDFLKEHNRRVIDDPSLISAGVFILFYESEDNLHLLFTKRTDFVEHHKGQVSFPGGFGTKPIRT